MARCLFLMCLLSASYGLGAAECSGAQCPSQDDRQALLQARVDLDDEQSAEDGMTKEYDESEDDEEESDEDAVKDEAERATCSGCSGCWFKGKKCKSWNEGKCSKKGAVWCGGGNAAPKANSGQACAKHDCAIFRSDCCNQLDAVKNKIYSAIQNGHHQQPQGKWSSQWAGRTIGYEQLKGCYLQGSEMKCEGMLGFVGPGIQSSGQFTDCMRTRPDLLYAWLASWAGESLCWQGKCVTFSRDLDRCGKTVLAEEISLEANGTKDQSLEETMTTVSEGNHDQSLEESLTGKRTC